MKTSKTTKQPITDEELAKRLSYTHPDFQKELRDISEQGGLTVLEVYRYWREYSEQCYDQSAILWEFRRWYAAKLGLEVAA